MTDRRVPHDLEAEAELLGHLLLHPERLPQVGVLVDTTDFYSPAHSDVYEAIRRLWGQSRSCDLVTVRDELVTMGRPVEGQAQLLISLQGRLGMAWERYAEIVARHALSRRIIQAGAELVEAGYRGDNDRALQEAGDLANDLPASGRPKDLRLLEEITTEEQERPRPWVVPGLLRAGWRVMLVGIEGYGKSSILYQIGTLASYGIHPFHFGEIRRSRVLFVDCENDSADITRNVQGIQKELHHKGLQSVGFHVWQRPGGLDLRTIRHRRQLEAVLREIRPELVILGPLYKAYRRYKGEADEDAVADLQPILDSFRTRHGFALLMEHHGAKAQGGERSLDPFGSSLWLRWPDLGYKLVPLTKEGKPSKERTGQLGVWSFRGDRKTNAWPHQIQRSDLGSPWPWLGWWKDPPLGSPDPEEPF